MSITNFLLLTNPLGVYLLFVMLFHLTQQLKVNLSTRVESLFFLFYLKQRYLISNLKINYNLEQSSSIKQ